jgi:hypothetical protein
VIYHCVENKFYFLQSEKWPYHFDFAKKFLGYKQSLSTFNVEMYLNEERNFILATIIRHRDQVSIFQVRFESDPKFLTVTKILKN